jgi:hypothetical protein
MKVAIVSALVSLGAAVSDVQAQDLIEVVPLTASVVDQDSSRIQGDRSSGAKDAWHGTLRLFFGGKALDENDWEPVESQSEFAILTDFGPEDWGVRIALDLRFAVSETEELFGLDVESSTWELNIGVRKVFDTKTIVKPFIGGGLAIGGATLDIEIDDDSDAGIGLWLDVGVDFSLGGPVSLGLELGYSTIPIDIADFSTDAGGLRFGLTIGFSW